MMMNCPKCGFAQPKDRYCASCGIDMQLYRPTRAPWFSRLATNWVFQLTAIAVLIVMTGAYLSYQRKEAFKERLAEVESAGTSRAIEKQLEKQLESGEDTDAAKAINENPPTSANPLAAQPNTLPSGETSFAPTQSAASSQGLAEPRGAARPLELTTATGAATAGNPAAGRPAAAGAAPQHIQVIFAEVRRDFWSELLNETRNLASYGPFSAGIVPDLRRKLRNGRANVTVLESASELPLKLNQPIILFKGARDESIDQNIGLTTQITPTLSDDSGVHVQVEVMRTLKEPAGSVPSVAEQSYQEQFIIPREGGAFLAGILPRKTVDEDDSRFYNSAGILKVYNSPTFQNNGSEFVIFIETK